MAGHNLSQCRSQACCAPGSSLVNGPGEALPSIVALAAEYRVTTNTVQKGLRILKAEGLVTSVPGYGTFVAE